ncbi:hypothetical protein [Sphingomonas turrisvirgatae]|uniref:Uncharacterized protein n=1 Tax=Sphingomonas turrisvirgatae TaxID=1888892 RepID=A0A1E3LRZ3_9SPHN|nr:hypothetical protein [Sphingomonas turrisvirgatae]ODP36511.1 hypothetical protein BFL28_05865 [Sphingomonas turrisvirgatae]
MATTAPTTETSTTPSNRKNALADSLRKHFSGDTPITGKARSFAKERPWATAALAGMAALAVGNLLRGRI